MLKRYTGGEWVEQGGGGGTNDYADLSNKPKINNTTLSGNKTSSDLGLQPAINGSAKVNADYIDDSTSTNKFVTAADKTNWNAKLGPGDTYTKQELDDEFTEIDNAIDAVKAGAAAGATALQPEDVASTYSSSGTAPINGTGVAAALSTLDVTAVGGSGKYISQISEVDGKIVPVVQTMDSTPTEESYKAISSDGVRADQQRQDAEIAVIANAGAKNLASKNSGSGTNSTAISKTPITLPIGDYICSFSASNYSGNAAFELWDASNSQQYVKELTVAGSNSFKFTVTGSMSVAKYSLYVNNATISDFMIRPAEITDGTFVPYALSNPVITPALIEQVNNGAKNKYPPFETQSSRGSTGVTYSYTNGIVHATGTKSGSLNYIEVVENRPISELGFSVGDTLVLSNTSDSLLLTIILGDGTTFDPAIIVGNETKELTIGAGKTHIYIRSQVLSSVTGTIDLSATPMICTKAAWDVSHQPEPYALPNPVITPALIKQVDEGAKNLVNFSNYSTINPSFVTESNGVVTVNGTSTTTYTIFSNVQLKAGAYIISGCPSGGGSSTYSIDLRTTEGVQILNTTDTGSGSPIITLNDTGTYRLSIRMAANYAATNLTFYPMICTLADWNVSKKYVPYALPNPTLTPAAIKAVDEGAKNIADFTSTTKTTYTTATFHGVTITRNGDIFTVSGTSDTNNNAFFNIYYEGSTTTKIIPPGNWVALIDDYTGSVVKDIAVQIAAPDVPPSKPYGTPVRFSLSGSETGNWLRVNIRPSTTYNGSFRLMICSQKDYAISTAFVPYAPTNRELYERNNVIDISSAVTAVTGYTVKSTTHLYYQNKKVFGTIAIAINSGSYPSSLTAIAKLPVEYAPARQHLGSCGFSTDQWAITDIGYAFIQGSNASSTAQRGQISVKSPTANLTHMILNVCYPVQIDGTL